MEIIDIINKNNGEIIKKGENVFEYWQLKCNNNHIFKLLSNDIKNGDWCQECDKIDKILKDIPIEFNKNKKIDDVIIDYVIDSEGRKFFIHKNENIKNIFKVANNNNYHTIIICNDKVSNLKEEIFKALKENKSSTYIGQKIEYTSNHQCIEEEIIKTISKDARSLVKKAILPYPQLVNKAVGYTRVSTERQAAEGHSLAAQENLLAIEAAKRNLFLKAIYIDEGISGKDIEHREALKKMMSELEEGDRVIVYQVERFARQLKDLLTLADEIKEKKCILIVPEMDIDFSTAQGNMMLAIRGSLAQYEREMTSKRVKDTHAYLKSVNRFISKPFFGWRVNPDKTPGAELYIRDEEEQRIIKNIRLLRERYPLMGITQFTEKVNQVGLEPPRKAKKWYHKYLKDLMIREGIWK